MNHLSKRSMIAVGSVCALLLLPVLYCIVQLLLLRQGYAEEIESIEPRTARLLGLSESTERLTTAGLQADAILEQVAYPEQRDSATTSAAMQQDVREQLIAAGMSISGSQIRPRQSEDGYDRLVLDLTAEGNIGALEQALLALEEMRPLVFVKELAIKPARVSRRRNRHSGSEIAGDQRKVTARFELVSLRVKA